MATILFKIYPTASHMIATYKLAKELKSRNHRIIYASIKQFKSEIRLQGFEFYTLMKEVARVPKKNTRKKTNFYTLIKHYKRIKKELQQQDKLFITGGFFDKIIDSIHPDLIVLDSPYANYAIDIFKFKIPFIVVESMVSLNKSTFKPPLNTYLIPNKKIARILLIDLSWKVYFIKTWFRHFLYKRIFLAGSNKMLLLKIAKQRKLEKVSFNFERFLHIGINNVPELILSPKEFDFPHRPRPNQYYFGPSVDLERKDLACDLRYYKLFKNSNFKIPNLVYCSIGSIPWHYADNVIFFKRIIEVFKNNPQWNLIVAIGIDNNYKQFEAVPDNVYIFQKVPQIDVLNRSKLMIAHGGMNSISECIMTGVPMIIYPTYNIDQKGNSARVKYHKLGLVGNVKSDSSKDISFKINEVFHNPTYRRNCLAMRDKILTNSKHESSITMIDSLLNHHF